MNQVNIVAVGNGYIDMKKALQNSIQASHFCFLQSTKLLWISQIQNCLINSSYLHYYFSSYPLLLGQ